MYYGVRYCDPVFERFIAPERIVPGAGALTAAPHDAVAQLAWAQGGGTPTTTTSPELNRYAYAQSTPLRCTDPTRHWIERAVDIAFIADDIWDIHQNGLTWDNGLALAAHRAVLVCYPRVCSLGGHPWRPLLKPCSMGRCCGSIDP